MAGGAGCSGDSADRNGSEVVALVRGTQVGFQLGAGVLARLVRVGGIAAVTRSEVGAAVALRPDHVERLLRWKQDVLQHLRTLEFQLGRGLRHQ